MLPPTHETYTELQKAYDHFNATLFGGGLPQCLLTLQREKKCLAGYFAPARFIRHDKSKATDEIAMNPMQFVSETITENMKTLAHEMTHQWQYHFGKDKGRRTYHNHEWGDKMKSIGLHPSSTGQPGGSETGQAMSEYIIAGGAFEKSCAELMTADFVLSWADRAGLEPEAIEGLPGELAAILGGLPAGGNDLTPADNAGVKRSGVRVKYYCPKCGANVWGKSELNIICGSCGVGFNIA